MENPDKAGNTRRGMHGRKFTIIGMMVLLFICAWVLGPGAETPPWAKRSYYHDTFKPFISAALQPTLTDQNQSLPDDATPFYIRVLTELANTFRYALIAMSMAVPAGIFFGFLASTTWWPDGSRSRVTKIFLRPFYIFARFLITLMRSIHELIWALFFLAAIGHSPIAACIALALPFTGTLAKVFSEIIDEQNTAARNQLVASGGKPLQAFLTTLIPQSFPDMATYTLYRFECALRSSAVLGFIGIETIGLSIKRSFENNFYQELWTELYLLLAVIMLVDVLGASLRKRLNSAPKRKHKPNLKLPDKEKVIQQLRRTAPRWKITRLLFWGSALLILIAWFPSITNIKTKPLTGSNGIMQHGERISLFLNKITPQPLRDGGTWSETSEWAFELWREPGKKALINTIAMATAAVSISALCAWLILPMASRAIANAAPLDLFNGKKSKIRTALWKVTGFGTRSFFLISRAIPEYIYAYLLIGLLGVSAWPLVIALAFHNFGILGRLWGEVMENQSPTAAKQIHLSGGTRFQGYFHSTMPESFNRFLMYLFYRWETCVREATVLGMLGFASLGLHINLSRNFSRAYDEMLFYVLLGSAVIFIGDFISILIRRSLRNSG